jgi:formamidopyrimidine-DNA glycosylase
MPELPEVETIRQSLRRGGPRNPSILGWTAAGGRVLWARTLATPPADEFSGRIRGQQLLEIDRRGKFLIFRWTQDALLVHLRMSGDILVEPMDAPPGKYDRLVIDFDHGMRLAFSDPRKFGRAWLVADPNEVVGRLGPEPLDEGFTGEDLLRALSRRKRQLKPLLLDQTFLAGLGNIYTDEALHLAHLHPLALSNQVQDEQAAQLLEAIRAVLTEGIERNGASIDWVYRGGDFQNFFRVYRRTGRPCAVCGTPIERIVVGQRGTHYCPVCQRLQAA